MSGACVGSSLYSSSSGVGAGAGAADAAGADAAGAGAGGSKCPGGAKPSETAKARWGNPYLRSILHSSVKRSLEFPQALLQRVRHSQ